MNSRDEVSEPQPRLNRGLVGIGDDLVTSLNLPGTLSVCADRLLIRALWRSWSFPRSDIANLQIIPVLFWRVIRIHHLIPEYACFFAFRPFLFSDVQQQLEDAGFPFTTA